MSKQDLHRTIFCLDNLEVLREMDSESIDLIYLDPPFNKKKEFNAPLKADVKKDIQKYFRKFNALNQEHNGAFCDVVLKWKADFEQPSFEDTWESEPDVRRGEEWVLKKDEAEGIKKCVFAYLIGLQNIVEQKCLPKGHLSYLCFMAVRLVEMHRILKSTGSIYLHCDPTMSHYLKTLLDMIFGVKNFRNEITWKRDFQRKNNTTRSFGRTTDIVFFYSKTNDYFFNPIYVPYTEEQKEEYFDKIEKETGRRYNHACLEIKNKNKYETRVIEGREVKTKIGWKWSQEYFDERLKENPNLIYWTKNERPRYKLYEDESKGLILENLWADIVSIKNDKEATGYPTQKPLSLLERIIQASSNEGDIVLDPFCGCATACIASYRLNRKYIGIDISEAAFMLLMYRIGQEAGWSKTQNELDLTEIKDRLPKLSFKSPTPSKHQKTPDVKYVYLISSPYFIKNNLYKVGIAADVEKRKKAYNTGDPGRTYEIIYSKLCANFREVEKAVIQKFPSAHPKAKGEWIKGEKEDIIAFIENLICL